VISTGGRLSALAGARGWPLFRYGFEGPPRTALAWSTLPLLAILARLGALEVPARAIADLEAELRRAASSLVPAVAGELNPAKQLARLLAGRPVLVLGAGPLEAAARRWAGQLNENAKQWAVHGQLPEATHNLVVPVAHGAYPRAAEQPFVVLLDAPGLDARVTAQVALAADLLAEAGAEHVLVRTQAASALGAIFEACQLGDWVSLYAAALNEVEPLATETLDRLKAQLAARLDGR
jgi:hypothetical protein